MTGGKISAALITFCVERVAAPLHGSHTLLHQLEVRNWHA